MNKYFIILNWSLLLFVLGIGYGFIPLLHTAWILVGTILAAMFVGGFSSWQYHKDKNMDKSQRWRNSYFNKNYKVEIGIQLIIALFFGGLAWWLASSLYIVTGFALTLALNYTVEWLYTRFTHKFPPL